MWLIFFASTERSISQIAIWVKGRCPLQVQGGAHELLPKAIFAKGAPEPNKASRTACAFPGQGTTSLAGAGRSPQTIADRQSSPKAKTKPNKSKPSGLRLFGSRDNVPCGYRAAPVKSLPKAISAARRNPNPTKQAERLAFSREAVARQSRDSPAHPPQK